MLLGRAGPDIINGQTNRGATALMLAASRGNRPMVEQLLADYRVDVNVRDFGSPQKTALDRCSRNSSEIAALIRNRAGAFAGIQVE